MTISSEIRKAGPYDGNDVTTSFPFAFKVFAASDVVVVLTDPAGAETTLTGGGTDYSVTLSADQDTSPGGTVEKISALATDYLLTITSSVPNLQPLTLTNQGGFYPTVINAAFDRLTILVQQVSEQVSRAVKTTISSSSTPDQLLSDIGAAVSTATSAATAASDSAVSASGSETAAAGSAAAAAQSAIDASNTPVALPTHAATSKPVLVDADEIPLIDSAASWGLAKLTWSNLKANIWSVLGSLIMTGTGKATPVDADYIALADSAAGNATKSLSWANIKAALKTYLDTLYQPIIGTVSMVRVLTPSGNGSTNTAIRRFTTVSVNQGADITYADSATLGASFTINTNGVYAISLTDCGNAAAYLGISKNSSQLTTAPQSISAADLLALINVGANTPGNASWSGYLPAGTIIRPHLNAVAVGSVTNGGMTVSRVS